MNDRIDERTLALEEDPEILLQLPQDRPSPAIEILRDEARVRKVVTKGHLGTQGKIPSIKNRRMIHWQGGTEDAVVKLLEFSTRVDSYQEQPEKFTYRYGEEDRNYTPDFLVTRAMGKPRSLYVEAKPEHIAQRPENQERFQVLREYFESIGAEFRVITDRQIDRKVLLWNLELLLRYRRPYLKDGPWVREFAKLHDALPLTFSRACQIIDRVVVLTALAFQYAEFDYRAERLGPQTTIQATNGSANGFLF